MTCPPYFSSRDLGCHAVYANKIPIWQFSRFTILCSSRASSASPYNPNRCFQVAAPARYASKRLRRHYRDYLVPRSRSYTKVEPGRRTPQDFPFGGAARPHEQRSSPALERGGAIISYWDRRGGYFAKLIPFNTVEETRANRKRDQDSGKVVGSRKSPRYMLD